MCFSGYVSGQTDKQTDIGNSSQYFTLLPGEAIQVLTQLSLINSRDVVDVGVERIFSTQNFSMFL